MKDLDGKVVMITGASGNLGSATSEKFLEFGSRLALVDRDADLLQRLEIRRDARPLHRGGSLFLQIRAPDIGVHTLERRRRETALARDLGGDTLPAPTVCRGIGEDAAIRVRVNIDEAG